MYVLLIFSEITDSAQHSKKLHVHERFKLNPYGPDVRGGGEIIPCIYIIEADEKNLLTYIKSYLSEQECTEIVDYCQHFIRVICSDLL